MKRLALLTISALSFGMLLITSCKEDEDILSKIDSTYVGTYTTTGPELLSITAPIIEFNDEKFACNGLSNGHFHDIQSGNFTITDNKIIFELTHIEHDPSMPNNIDLMLAPWFDDWLLKGEYEYKIDGNKLSFSKTATVLEKEYKFEFEFIKSK